MMATDGLSLGAVALIRRHKLDAAEAVSMVVPVHEQRHPAAGFLHAVEGPSGAGPPTSVTTAVWLGLSALALVGGIGSSPCPYP